MDNTCIHPRMGQATDEELARLVKERDVRAFELLYDRYSARALRVALAITGDRALAEEAVQEAFVSIWRRAGRYDPRSGAFPAWALSVVRYRAIDLVRSRRTHAPEDALDAYADEGADTEATVEQRLETARIRRQLAHLPLPQRELIVLAFFGGLSHAELAAHLSLPLGTVKGRIRLALEKLRDLNAGELPRPHPAQPAQSQSRIGRRQSTTPVRRHAPQPAYS